MRKQGGFLLSLITHHLSLLRYWDRKRERRALADLGLHLDLAAVEFDELARDVEAEPRPLLAARGARARLRVLVEDVAHVLRRDADARVGDGDAHRAALARGRDADAPALGRELQGVRDEVDQHPAQLRTVGAQGGQVFGYLLFERDLLLGGERLHLLAQLVDQAAQAHRGRVQAHRAGLELGGVQQVVHQLDEVLRVALHHRDHVLLLRGELAQASRGEEVDDAADDRQGRAQVVRGEREELLLHRRELAQLGVGLVQLAVRLFEAAVDLLQLLALLFELAQDLHEVAVLPRQLFERGVVLVGREEVAQLVGAPARLPGLLGREPLDDRDARALARARLDVELVHQAARADEADAEARGRAVGAALDGAQLRLLDAGAVVARGDLEAGRGVAALRQRERDGARARVLVDVAREFGDRGRDLDLSGRVEAHLAGEAPDALAHLHDVGLAPDVDVAEPCRGDALHTGSKFKVPGSKFKALACEVRARGNPASEL